MTFEININMKDFIKAQIFIVSLILLLGLFSYIFSEITGNYNLFGILRMLDVDSETSLPTYFSTLNLLLSSLLLFIIYKHEKTTDGKLKIYWLLLSLLFLFLSLDEGIVIHEEFRKVIGYAEHKGIIPRLLDKHRWLPFGVLFVTIAGFVFFPFMRRLPRKTLLYFIAAGSIFILGAIGFEYIVTLLFTIPELTVRQDVSFRMLQLVEEGLEMFGIVLFNCALLREILNRNITLIFQKKLSPHSYT